MRTVPYSGQECCVLENPTLRLLVTRSVGPRILWFGFQNGENLLADLPNFTVNLPSGGVFHFYGGHRLWVAPEDFSTTYAPDDSPVEVSEIDNSLIITKSVESQTGLQKAMEILLAGETQVVIKHHITNRKKQPVTCAPWAITQLRAGGIAILPQTRQDTGVLPNRSLALWSYSDPSNPNVIWGKHHILIRAEMRSPFKIGFPNPRGWLAYWLNGVLFVKHADHHPQAEYYDFNSSSECYCNDEFLELETLAPITDLHPGQTVSHIETWNIYKDVPQPQNEDDVPALIETLKLE